MAENAKSVSLGGLQVFVVKGDLAAEQADVIICAANKKLDLGRGRASCAIMEAAGESMQEECYDSYPEGIDQTQVAVVDGGNLQCRKVFFIALPVWTSGGAQEKDLKTLVTKCLSEATQQGATSVSFPALGTGYLRYPVDIAARATFSSVASFVDKNAKSSVKTIRIVVYPKDTDTYQAFIDQARDQSCGGDNDLVLDKLMSFRATPTTASGRGRAGSKYIGRINVSVVTGKLAEFQADVIVNNSNSKLQLENGGLSDAILLAAGSQLQQECKDKYPKGLVPGQVAVTGGYGLKAPKVYHGSLPEWDQRKDSKCRKVLREFIGNCLQQADTDRVVSMAIPTLGSGSLNFPMDVVANAIYQCIADFECDHSNTSLRYVIIIVNNQGDEWRKIKQVFEEELAEFLVPSAPNASAGADPLVSLLQGMASGSSSPPPPPHQFQLPVPLQGILPTKPHRAAPVWNTTVKPSRGSKEFFRFMYKSDPRTPPYWTVFHSHKTLKDWHSESEDIAPLAVPVDQKTFDNVSKVVESTWQSQLVGHGRDAQGLGNLNYSGIDVRFVHRIENSQLFEKYSQKRQELFQKAAKTGAFKQLKDIRGSKGEIATTKAVTPDSVLTSETYPEVNEHYLFHGTTPDLVDVIVKQGMDCRLAGSGAMLGPGIYCAESSTKSDQYSDSKSSRSDGLKKMLLIRVCLGDIHVHDQAKSFKRAPCKQCGEDKCKCKNAKFFDSVVGDGSWNFREFVVYDRTQVYPEYVISYKRQ